MTDAKKILENQIAKADSAILAAKAKISRLDDQIRRESFDMCKLVNSLSGESLGCHASNIISLGTDMARACTELQSAQDAKQAAESTIEMLNA